MKKLAFLGFVVVMAASVQSVATDKVLKVGTTGDYAPLTFKTEAGGYEGYSIEVIHKFAGDSGYSVEFVPTTWSTMSSDLMNKKFEIAVGGISYSLPRASQFSLSKGVASSAKIALIRCKDKRIFPDSPSIYKAMNNQHTRIVENRGGTNETFAKENFPLATFIVVKNNELPFAYLERDKADVMVTDLIEGMYKMSHGYTALCVANPAAVFGVRFNKVFMARKSDPIIQAFDSWLNKPINQRWLDVEQEKWGVPAPLFKQ